MTLADGGQGGSEDPVHLLLGCDPARVVHDPGVLDRPVLTVDHEHRVDVQGIAMVVFGVADNGRQAAAVGKFRAQGFQGLPFEVLVAHRRVPPVTGGARLSAQIWATCGLEGDRRIGLAPISAVLSSRVAVQAKRYDPATTVGRETVALFQRDAAAAWAEHAVLVTLARFSRAARKAATATMPTVDLIDGDKICDLVRDQEIGLRIVPQVDGAWFDRFDA